MQGLAAEDIKEVRRKKQDELADGEDASTKKYQSVNMLVGNTDWHITKCSSG